MPPAQSAVAEFDASLDVANVGGRRGGEDKRHAARGEGLCIDHDLERIRAAFILQVLHRQITTSADLGPEAAMMVLVWVSVQDRLSLTSIRLGDHAFLRLVSAKTEL